MRKKFKMTFYVLIILSFIMNTAIVYGSDNTEAVSTFNKDIKDDKETLRINIDYIDTFDPQITNEYGGKTIVNNMFEGLMKEVNGKLELGIAESYTISSDKKVYTFKLKDTKWSDGKEVVASDFEYAWKRAIDPENDSYYSWLFFDIKGAEKYYDELTGITNVGIETVDDKTLKITLEEPASHFITMLSQIPFMPVRKDIVEQNPKNWSINYKTAVSNGPFKLSCYIEDKKIILDKNEDYYNADNVKLDRVDVSMVQTNAEAIKLYNSNQIDIIDRLYREDFLKNKEREDIKLIPSLSTYYGVFNIKKEPLNDVRVRKALSMVIDRQFIRDEIYSGLNSPAYGFVSDDVLDSNGNNFREKSGKFDLEKSSESFKIAKQLLTDAGYENGEGFPELTISLSENSSSKLKTYIKDVWEKELGIKVSFIEKTFGANLDDLTKGNYDIGLFGFKGDYNDPLALMELFRSEDYYNFQWDENDYDQIPLAKQIDLLVDEAENKSGEDRDKILYELESTIMNNHLVMPIIHGSHSVLVKPYVTNWDKSNFGYWYFGNIEIKNSKSRIEDAIVLYIGNPYSYVNNITKKIDENNSEIIPIIENNRTLVPVRFISESLGANITWEPSTKTVGIDINEDNIVLQLGSNKMIINGVEQTIDVPAKALNGRTYVPLRAIVEALKKEVFYDRGIIIISDTPSIIDKDSESYLIDEMIDSFRNNTDDEIVLQKEDISEEILDTTEIAKFDKSVVSVVVLDGYGDEIAQGSGFYIGNGLFVTNYHVIKDNYYIKLITNDEHEIVSDGVVSYNEAKDIAIIKAKNIFNLEPLKLGHKDMLVKGEQILTIGSPLGYSSTISDGIVSGFRDLEEVSYIQITAPITNGSSGGPLFNRKGYVVGINTSGYNEGNLNFSIAIDELEEMIKELNHKSYNDIPKIDNVSNILSLEKEKEKVLSVVYALFDAFNDEDLAKVKEVYPNIENENYMGLEMIFEMYDLDYNIERIEVSKMYKDSASVKLIYTLENNDSDEFEDSEMFGSYVLSKIDGEWKVTYAYEVLMK